MKKVENFHNVSGNFFHERGRILVYSGLILYNGKRATKESLQK